MREQFPWFLDPTEEELQRLWDEATFSFDANVLLNLYRVDRETTEDYFKIFRAFGDRIFLTHEAANQFFLNRRDEIRTEQNSFSKAKKLVRNWVERRTGFDNLKKQLKGDNIGQIIQDEIESVFEEREGYEEEVEAVKEDLIDRIEDLEGRFTPSGTTRANAEEDEILGELMEIFERKTGSGLDEEMEDLKAKARERYESEQPPGYEDHDGGDELSRGECEDFLIWKQLMEFAEQEGKDIVFVTGEEKPDWWEVYGEHNIVRPRHELLREFKRGTGQVFWMLSTERMLDSAYERLGVEVRDKSVEQTESISKSKDLWYYKNDSHSLRKKIRELRGEEDLFVLKIITGRLENIRSLISEGEWAKANQSAQKVDERMPEPLASIIVDTERLTTTDAQVIAEKKKNAFEAVFNEQKEAALSRLSELSQYLNRIADLLSSNK